MVARPLASPGRRRENGRALFRMARLSEAPSRRVRSAALFLLGLGALASPLANGAPTGSAALDVPEGQGPPVRVLLLEGPQITIGAAGKEGLQLRDARDRPLLRLEPGRQLRVRRVGDSLTLEPLATGIMAAVEGPSTPRLVPLQDLRVEPIDPNRGLVVLKRRRYRGLLQLRPEGEGLQAINRLPLETYLLGVVGGEMPVSWPQAALRAQAVASRTYALRQMRPKAPFDLKATVASQVYKGLEGESESTRQAVTSTRAQVLMHGRSLINAVFHSSSGDRTEDSGEIWSRQLPYLVSVPDFDSASPVSRWEKDFAPETLRAAFQEIGGAFAIHPLQTSKTGRLRRAKVIGPGGELVLTGSEMRERLGLRSTLVEFQFQPADRIDTATSPPSASPPLPSGDSASGEPVGPTPAQAASTTPLPPGDSAPRFRLVARGRGYGHGVGMSQWGAYALALRGTSYVDILRHYYKGAVLRSY
ncbi:MAG: SpoIID/LytB domain-containing protein [Cyanobacteriota bacterium]